MPNDNLLQLLNLPTQNANTEMDNQNDNTSVNWQSDLLGWVYSNTLESVLLTWLTNNQMSKQDSDAGSNMPFMKVMGNNKVRPEGGAFDDEIAREIEDLNNRNPQSNQEPDEAEEAEYDDEFESFEEEMEE